jgi:hypothetical protein
MKKITILLLLLLAGFQLSAQQNCDCRPELDFVYEQIKTTESYKYQIKDEMSDLFEKTYQQLGRQMTTPLTQVQCFEKLTQLLGLIKDKHALLMGTARDYKVSDLEDSRFIETYRKSEVFTQFPKTDRDLIVLEKELKQKPIEDVEGIYTVGTDFRLGMYRIDQTDSLVAVVLESTSAVWAPGHVYLYMRESDLSNHYDIIVNSQIYKVPVYKSMQLVEHGILYGNIMKENIKENHTYINPEAQEAYVLKSLNDKTQYVWLDDFGRNTENANKRDALVAQMDKELKAANLIVDLRNNGGGATKISWPIVKKIRKYAKTANVYVITNKMSGSNAEQTTLRLIKMAGAKHLGQKTFGAVAYGRNYGTRVVSSSGLFRN